MVSAVCVCIMMRYSKDLCRTSNAPLLEILSICMQILVGNCDCHRMGRSFVLVSLGMLSVSMILCLVGTGNRMTSKTSSNGDVPPTRIEGLPTKPAP